MEKINSMKKLWGKSFEAFTLDWDTIYFDVKSAKVILKEDVCEDERNKLMSYLNTFDFITIINLGNNYYNNLWIGKETRAFLTDINIQLIKQINNRPIQVDESTNVCVGYPRDEHILKIAKKSFIYSRFFNDPWLPEDKAKSIYVHWTECAFDKPDRYFIITKRQGKIAGYLIFSINLEIYLATIELVAVDDVYKGQNVGKSLIDELKIFACMRGIRSVKVGTQIENIIATKFYNRCGFQYASCNAVYHYWPQK